MTRHPTYHMQDQVRGRVRALMQARTGEPSRSRDLGLLAAISLLVTLANVMLAVPPS